MNNSLSPYLCFQCQTFPEVAEDGGFVVRCHSCGLSVTDKHHRLNAISAWNIINDPVNNEDESYIKLKDCRYCKKQPDIQELIGESMIIKCSCGNGVSNGKEAVQAIKDWNLINSNIEEQTLNVIDEISAHIKYYKEELSEYRKTFGFLEAQ